MSWKNTNKSSITRFQGNALQIGCFILDVSLGCKSLDRNTFFMKCGSLQTYEISKMKHSTPITKICIYNDIRSTTLLDCAGPDEIFPLKIAGPLHLKISAPQIT